MRTLLIVVLMVITVPCLSAGTIDGILESLAERTEQEPAVVSDVEVVELLRVETADELEYQLTDGYPMPWLEEILNDESIPEEDRYWLDCRMRAAIAQDLHLF
ncbi:MAG: hypothetical protein GF388_02595, partial [Candidatus Aegiribacteria sp.]|nr:hypothetical protein [Candidatus Aegiribacteria sp.]